MTILGWGGEVCRYFHLYLGSEHYFWLKISEKKYFWEYEDLWIFFFLGGGGGGVITKSDFFEEGHFYTF